VLRAAPFALACAAAVACRRAEPPAPPRQPPAAADLEAAAALEFEAAFARVGARAIEVRAELARGRAATDGDVRASTDRLAAAVAQARRAAAVLPGAGGAEAMRAVASAERWPALAVAAREELVRAGRPGEAADALDAAERSAGAEILVYRAAVSRTALRAERRMPPPPARDPGDPAARSRASAAYQDAVADALAAEAGRLRARAAPHLASDPRGDCSVAAHSRSC